MKYGRIYTNFETVPIRFEVVFKVWILNLFLGMMN